MVRGERGPIPYRTPPRGGGVSPDLRYLSKITGFLKYLSPMLEIHLMNQSLLSAEHAISLNAK